MANRLIVTMDDEAVGIPTRESHGVQFARLVELAYDSHAKLGHSHSFVYLGTTGTAPESTALVAHCHHTADQLMAVLQALQIMREGRSLPDAALGLLMLELAKLLPAETRRDRSRAFCTVLCRVTRRLVESRIAALGTQLTLGAQGRRAGRERTETQLRPVLAMRAHRMDLASKGRCLGCGARVLR